MNIKEYQKTVVGLLNPTINNGPFMEKVGYLIAKMSSETGELFGEFCKRQFHGKTVTPEKLKDELGDIAWYIFNLIDILEPEYQASVYDIFQIERNGMTADDAVFVSFMTLTRNCGQACDYWTVGAFAQNNIKCQSVLVSVLCGITHIYLTLVDELGFSLEEILDGNIEKLSKRHNGKTYDPLFYTEAKSV